ncbi:hypothetical protein DPEC_G00242580 [Dallia pectoralis]|uniref:Uncharacterized protein n=1 Tax=Dallia pectoralis TaxID=75939 RepID=A0ACC2FV70_DALPE|nr:hypothetical protein DPEC_G00242580 [Dallia pectoralis]
MRVGGLSGGPSPVVARWTPLRLALLCVWCCLLSPRCLGARAGAASGDGVMPGVSVLVVSFPTDAGAAAEDGANEGATPAPNTEHDDDNSLGYTGTEPPPHLLLPPSHHFLLCVSVVGREGAKRRFGAVGKA